MSQAAFVDGTEATLWAAFGRKGTGKNTLAHAIVREHQEWLGLNVVVLDATREWKSDSRTEVLSSRWWTLEDACSYVIEKPHKTMLLVEEAHKYLPNHAGGVREGTALQAIIYEGRHLGTSLGIVSPRIAKVNLDVTELADTVFLMRHTGSNSLERIRKLAGDEFAEAARNLQPGDFLRVDF